MTTKPVNICSDPDFLEDLRAFLEAREDILDAGDWSDSMPNDAMKLLMRLNELFPEEK